MSNHSEMVCTKCNGEGLVEHPMWKAYLADLSAGKFPKPVQHYIYCDQCCGYGHYATQAIADQPPATAPNPALKEVDPIRSDGRLYDHAGFTHAVDHILPAPEENGIIRFTITSQQAFKILKRLPCLAPDAQNGSPTFAEFVVVGQLFPDLRFLGYRVSAARFDERITLEGYLVPEAIADQVLNYWAVPPDYYGLDPDYPHHYMAVWD